MQCSEFALQLSTSNNRDVLSSEPLQPADSRPCAGVDEQRYRQRDAGDVRCQPQQHYLSSLAATQSLVLIHNKVRRSMGIGRRCGRGYSIADRPHRRGVAAGARGLPCVIVGTEAAAIAEAVKQLRGNVQHIAGAG